MANKEAAKEGKTIEEYEVTMADKSGRTLTYNSIDGVVPPENFSRYYALNILKVPWIGYTK